MSDWEKAGSEGNVMCPDNRKPIRSRFVPKKRIQLPRVVPDLATPIPLSPVKYGTGHQSFLHAKAGPVKGDEA